MTRPARQIAGPASGLPRRSFLAGAASGLVGLGGGVFRPSISRAADRPILSHGLQSGDIDAKSGVVWARADRPSRAWIEWATTERLSDVRGGVFVDCLPESDLVAKIALEGLPAGQDVFYRVRLQDLAEPTILGPAAVGRFRTAPADRRGVAFCWSGDTAGQGWGIDEARGGMTIYGAIAQNRPDFFIHSGDTIYADAPIRAEVRLPDGSLWRNRVTEEVSNAAQTLREFRGRYKYNLTDANLLALNAQVPILAQWDDHEVTNNWWPGEPLTRAHHRRLHYADPNMLALQARAARAFHEYIPMRFQPAEPGRVYRRIPYGPLVEVFLLDMRSYRGPNGENRQTEYGPDAYFLGPTQVAWLKQALRDSRAAWKVIAADMPLGLVVIDDVERHFGSEAVAQGDGEPLGRELEIADLLRFIKHAGIRNTVWLTADVHYTAAHRYDPNRARFQDFAPFWEFVSGPLHAGTGSVAKLDDTFGPEVRFAKAAPSGQADRSPAAGLQFFGHVAVDGRTEQMTVTLKDAADTALWSVVLDPEQAG